MLDVDDLPDPVPCNKMSVAEPYVSLLDSINVDSDGGSSDLTEIASSTSTLKHQTSTHICQEPPIANAHAFSLIFTLLCSCQVVNLG